MMDLTRSFISIRLIMGTEDYYQATFKRDEV